jgi:phosphotransferase system enzyme I (PtsP)
MMVELPSVLETLRRLLEADFFSIGSNDFIQYMLAADRGNESVAAYYCAHHPAVLRGIARFVRTAPARPVASVW